MRTRKKSDTPDILAAPLLAPTIATAVSEAFSWLWSGILGGAGAASLASALLEPEPQASWHDVPNLYSGGGGTSGGAGAGDHNLPSQQTLEKTKEEKKSIIEEDWFNQFYYEKEDEQLLVEEEQQPEHQVEASIFQPLGAQINEDEFEENVLPPPRPPLNWGTNVASIWPPVIYPFPTYPSLYKHIFPKDLCKYVEDRPHTTTGRGQNKASRAAIKRYYLCKGKG